MQLYPRYIESRVRQAMADTPVVLLNGPRQSGKTTLVRQFASPRRRFVTLDDELTLLAASEDPVGFVRGLDCAIVDEVQRAPGLLLAIKKSVDEDRRPGRFLLTGSSNLMMLPTAADSLAGRMEILTLLPLAGCELRSGSGKWLDEVYRGKIPQVLRPEVGSLLMERVLCGGYPVAVARENSRRRSAWLRQYVDALIQRDVRDVAGIDKLDHLSRLLKCLAQLSGRLCNFAQLGGQVGLDGKTAGKYLTALEGMFLLRRVAPWNVNRLSRIVKTPKVQFLDSGLLAALSGLNPAPAAGDRAGFGRVLESYVFAELLKLASWADGDYSLYSYRDKDQFEVDFVIEDAAGRIAGVEVKAGASVHKSDLAGLKRLASLAGRQWTAGIVLYDGSDAWSLGEGLWAVPLSSLWGA